MNAEKFGKYLRERRKAKGLTLEGLGEKISLSKPYLSHIENGKRGIPSPDILNKLAEPLGVPYMQLMYHAGHVTMGEVDKGFFGALVESRIQRLRNFLTKAEQLLTGDDGELKPAVRDELAEFLSDVQLSGVDADHFMAAMKKILADLAEVIRQGGDVEGFLKQHANVLRAQQFLTNRYIENLSDAVRTKPLLYELEDILGASSNVPVHFRSQLLQDEDRQRILDMLAVLFPDRK